VLYAIMKFLIAPGFRLLFRPVVQGRRNIPTTGPVILASNHLSFADSVVLPLVAPRRVVFLAKAQYFEGRSLKGRLTRWWFEAIGSVPVDRASQHAARGTLETALRVLHDGHAFGIYPEGTRSGDGRLYRGRTGVGWLALTSGAPVIPVGLIGTDVMQPIDARLPRLHRVTVRFGAPVDLSGYAGMAESARARRAATDAVIRAIGELTGQEYVNGYNGRTPTSG